MAYLSKVPSGVAICHDRNRDGMTNQKNKIFVKRGFGVATIVIIGNYGKPYKKSKVYENRDWGYGS